MIEGAAILLAGMVLGHWLSRRILSLRLRGLGRLPPKPVCSCKHAPSFHDPETGRCHYKWKAAVNYLDVWQTCACRRYDGPTPLPEYYAPELNP